MTKDQQLMIHSSFHPSLKKNEGNYAADVHHVITINRHKKTGNCNVKMQLWGSSILQVF